MNRTSIEWALNPDGSQGYTWNPITGCLNGCEYCYARKLANGRLKSRYLANINVAPIELSNHPSKLAQYSNRKRLLQSLDPFYPRFREDKLFDPMLQRKTPKGIFVCDMSDLFGIGVPELWTAHIITTIKCCPMHRFYLLTKQPQNLVKFSPFPDNCWVGVTATSSRYFAEACGYLRDVQASVKYLSIEPYLGEIIGSEMDIMLMKMAGIGQVIIGAQTKPYKPPKVEWVEEIVQACDKAGIPVFLKDNLLVEHDKALAQGLWNLERRQEMPEGR